MVTDLVDFDKDSLQQLADNLRRPGGCVQDPNPGAPAGATIPTPPFVFGAKSQKHITFACDLVRFYSTVGCDLTAANLQWSTVMKNFEIQWMALKERKGDDSPDIPKISKVLPVIKWMEAFQDFLNRKIGNHNIPLAYIIHDEPNPPAAAPPLAAGQPHSIEHGSVEAELIARVSHTHALFCDENSDLYYLLEEATQGTQYAASIKPFQQTKDGSSAWVAPTSQYAGKDKWEAELKKQEQLLHTHIGKGQSNFSLKHFISQHCNAYVSMSACAEHVQYQLPNEHSHVGLLINAIQCANARLQATMASIKTDNGLHGLQNNFERAVAHLLPHDPVAKKRATGIKRGSALISLAEVETEPTATIAANDAKPSIGKTGVHLHYHKHHGYRKLMHEQCCELSEWQQNNPDTHKPSYVKKPCVPDRSTRSKQISTLVSKQVAAKMQKLNKSTHIDTALTAQKAAANNEQYLMPVVQSAVAKHFASPPNPPKRQQSYSYSPPSNWKAIIEQAHKKMNKST